ncbi:uncharacterized protein MYCFIDRAFT_194716 [Pseudocercospora fijiensis CIRAD86]|uniref:Uncharacterized protein n=1 Tax=Pseudocercospora fijiensis (strain CIRAD86) TaxID=383855 RepID=M3BC72_PSEFD|nr:uncharacterized protein MYCFIDRAFT_194716 [Pseudocercospora fijiensis CIRAD86]EME86748.1 hypothetical protein MYCFIDRAFT_194716 [Pseudocercospora fijiensis CIRAD86]
MLFPPSPTRSECDSLYGIDDLDAFLDAQGKLSRFPTPPPVNKDAIIILETEERSHPSREYRADDNMDYHSHVVHLFRQQAITSGDPDQDDDLLLLESLSKVQLPFEMLQLALSILTLLRNRDEKHLLPPDTSRTAWPLYVLAACMLAADYLDDTPRSLIWWRYHFCGDHVGLDTLNGSKLELLKCLDWTLHLCASDHAMESARMRLSAQPAQEHHVWAKYALPQGHEYGPFHRRIDSGVDGLTAQLEHPQIK